MSTVFNLWSNKWTFSPNIAEKLGNFPVNDVRCCGECRINKDQFVPSICLTTKCFWAMLSHQGSTCRGAHGAPHSGGSHGFSHGRRLLVLRRQGPRELLLRVLKWRRAPTRRRQGPEVAQICAHFSPSDEIHVFIHVAISLFSQENCPMWSAGTM